MLDESEGDARNELSGTVAGPSVQAGSIYGGIRFYAGSRPSFPTPAQLPGPGLCAGRDRELAGLRRLTMQDIDAGYPFLLVITGVAGVGKTALALNWLHKLREQYAGGQLFVDLRGFAGDGDPMPPHDALGQFLRALGIDAASVPATQDERAALFRSLTTERRLIILLDNADSVAQVRPLLPGPGPALIVVTTRKRLPELARAVDGAHFLHLTPLDEPGALKLLSGIVSRERIQAEPDAALSLVSLCGGLPHAVCASGDRLAAHQGRKIARVVAELADDARRLSALRAVFDGSYRALTEDAARLYRLLSVHPPPEFEPTAAAALAGVNDGEVARLLDSLVEANLLEAANERFRFHDLIRLHAHEKLMEAESETTRQAAYARLVEHYLATQDRAVRAADV